MKRFGKVIFVLLAMLLIGGVCTPHMKVEAASKVKVVINKKTRSYSGKKSYLMINGQKMGLSATPIFKKNGCFVGPALEIFKNGGLGVTYTESADHKYLCLKSYGHSITLTSGSAWALIDGTGVKLPSKPQYIKYVSGSQYRWVVPLKSICYYLGIGYNKTSKGVIQLTKKVVLVLDAGHGGTDSGATGNGCYEKFFNMAIVAAAKSYFDQDNRFTVYYTRTDDSYPSLAARAALANQVNADLFISVHINSAAADSTGTETLYSLNRNATTAKGGITSAELAAYMQTCTVSVTGFRNRGIVNRPNLYVLKYTKMPACLIEYGFISNPTECASMNMNLTRYGQNLYQAVVNYLKTKNKIS